MNDIEKAIEHLKERVVFMENFLKEKELMGTLVLDKEKILSLMALNKLFIEALEKQVPKKPIQKSWSIAKCPCCGAELGEWLEDGYHKDYTNLKICDCGQKLDWSENQ